MKMKELLEYEGCSCRVKFDVKSRKTKLGNEQNRTGFVRAITMKVLVLWPLECDDEIHIPIDDVNEIEYL